MVNLIEKVRRGLGLCVPLLLTLTLVASCSKDTSRTEEPGSLDQGKAASISLAMSVSVDDESFRALEYSLQPNAKGQLVPMPMFTDKQKVDVHTMIKSNTGAIAAKTVKWTYSADTKTLRLLPGDEGNAFPLTNFNNENSRKWYVTGMIGGTLGADHSVVVTPTRDLKAAANLNDELGSYDVPYAFAWTELEIHTSGEKEGNSYKEASVTPLVTFKPQGAFVKFQLGNKQEDNTNPSFTLKSFTVSSNNFGDQGKFDMNTTPNPGGMPKWSAADCGTTMLYTIQGTSPSITHGAKMDKYYYAWVMPEHRNIVRTSVVIRGESTGETSITKSFFSDYVTKDKNLTSGLVHLLSANVSKPVYLPIEYITEYNLAGGGSSVAVSPIISSGDASDYIGHTGQLRFANLKADGQPEPNPHANNRSSHYMWTSVSAGANPDQALRNLTMLDVDGQSILLKDKYRIPQLDDWWGIFPSATTAEVNLQNIGISMVPGMSQRLKTPEHMKVGDATEGNLFAQNYTSEYTPARSINTNDVVVYALRFMKQEECASIEKEIYLEDKLRFYPPASDNTMACAYRFQRVGSRNTWEDKQSMNHHLIIEVVYLGEEVVSTSLETIENEAWWNTKRSGGKVYKLIFPAVRSLSGSNYLVGKASASNLIEYYYWSTLTPKSNPASGSRTTMTADFVRGGYYMVNSHKLPVRLFKKRPQSNN